MNIKITTVMITMMKVLTVVEDLLFHHDRLPPCLPIAALVEFAKYTVPVF